MSSLLAADGLPLFINLRPVVLDPIPWGWENTLVEGKPCVKSPGSIDMPMLWKYFHWNMLDYEGTENCPEPIYGTRNEKSIFSTAVRFMGMKKLLAELPSLSPITHEFLFWNRMLFLASPEKITYFVIGDDVADANGVFGDPDLFHNWILPEWRKLTNLAHDNNCKVIIRSSGDISTIINDILTLKPWGIAYEAIGHMTYAASRLRGIVELFPSFAKSLTPESDANV